MRPSCGSWAAYMGVAGVCLGCGTEGSFSILTYNVAGLPEGLSGSHPEANSPLISPLLNPFDVVLLQEDFTYHDQIVSRADHPYRSEPKVPVKPVNDGLNQLSTVPFGRLHREPWRACFGAVDNGSDCLSEKGFTMSTLMLADGLEAVLVNLHMDAGRGQEDRSARIDQLSQLRAALTSSAAGDALIIGGDTNLRADTEDAALLDQFLLDMELEDACRELDCGDERIDRVMVRDGTDVVLTVTSWRVAGEFVDGQGADLSDHKAVEVAVHYETR